jgi:hypothetical protein
MEKALKDILLAILISDSLNMGKRTVKEYTLGKMEKYMMESGIKELNKDMEFGKE